MEPWRAPALYKGVSGCQAASAGSPHRRALPVLPHLLLTFQCWLLIHLLKSKNQQKPQWGGNRTCPWLFSAPRAAIRLLDRDGRPASFPEVLRHSSIIPWCAHPKILNCAENTQCYLDNFESLKETTQHSCFQFSHIHGHSDFSLGNSFRASAFNCVKQYTWTPTSAKESFCTSLFYPPF